MGERKNVYKISVGEPGGKRGHREDQSIDDRVILKWILRKWVWWCGLD
jgi:hypothetical protein